MQHSIDQKARKLVSDAITAMFPANVDLVAAA
jgi:hypothetical protein